MDTNSNQNMIKNLDKYFGVYAISSRTAIPLKEIKVQAQIDLNITKVNYSQKFVNNTDEQVDAEYFFPISASACYDGFRIKTGENFQEATIKEKENKNSDGTSAASKKSHSNVLHLNIGKIEPQAEVEIEVSYIEFLTLSSNKYYQFKLHSSLTPNPELYNSQFDLTQYPTNEGAKFSLNISLDVGSKSLNEVECKSHQNVKIEKEENSSKAQISFEQADSCALSNDFALLYEYSDINQPNCTLTKYNDQYCAQISYFPQVSLEKKLEDDKILSQEFVFLIDNNERVGKSNLAFLSRVAKLLLNALPDGVNFKIQTFSGENTCFEFEGSNNFVSKTSDSFRKGCEFLNSINLNDGKSDLLSALKEYLDNQDDQSSAKNIFVISDGNFEDPSGINSYLNDNIGEKSQVNAYSLGEKLNKDAISELVKAGKGNSIQNSSEPIVIEELNNLLANSFHSYLSNFELELEDGLKECIEYINPNPKSLKHIVPNQQIRFFVLLSDKFNDLKKNDLSLKFNDSSKGESSVKITLDIENVIESNNPVKLGLYELSQSSEKENQIFVGDAKKDDESKTKEIVQGLILKASIDLGFLSEETTFVCNNDDSDKQVEVLAQSKVEEDESDEEDVWGDDKKDGEEGDTEAEKKKKEEEEEAEKKKLEEEEAERKRKEEEEAERKRLEEEEAERKKLEKSLKESKREPREILMNHLNPLDQTDYQLLIMMIAKI